MSQGRAPLSVDMCTHIHSNTSKHTHAHHGLMGRAQELTLRLKAKPQQRTAPPISHLGGGRPGPLCNFLLWCFRPRRQDAECRWDAAMRQAQGDTKPATAVNGALGSLQPADRAGPHRQGPSGLTVGQAHRGPGPRELTTQGLPVGGGRHFLPGEPRMD